MAFEMPEDIAAHIRRVRAARGLTQIAFGALLGVSNVTVNRWERSRVRPTGTV